MSKKHYVVENVETGEKIGTIKEIAEKNDKEIALTFEEFYQLNKIGKVNFRTKRGKYIHGPQFEWKEKSLNIYQFNVYLSNTNGRIAHALFYYAMVYLRQPLYMILLVWLLTISKFLVPTDQFILISIIFVLMIFHIFLHELGHYVACCYYNIPCMFHVNGLKNAILFKTDSHKENVVVSLAGIMVSISLFVIMIMLATILEDSFLKYIIIGSSILMFIIYLMILPKSVDMENIRNSFTGS